jgi:hypothetical protein
MQFVLLQHGKMNEQPSPPLARSRSRWLVWAFASIGVAAALAVLFLAVMVSSEFNRRPPAQVAAEAKGEVWVVDDVSQLVGTDYVTVAINGPNGRAGSGSIKGGYDDQRNLLLIHQKTGEVHRLLPDNRTRIADIRFAPAAAAGSGSSKYDNSDMSSKDHPPAYYAVQLARGEDKGIDLLIGQLAGFRQIVIMQGLDGIDRIWMIDDHQMGLILRDKDRLYFRVVDIPAQKVVRSQLIKIG